MNLPEFVDANHENLILAETASSLRETRPSAPCPFSQLNPGLDGVATSRPAPAGGVNQRRGAILTSIRKNCCRLNLFLIRYRFKSIRIGIKQV
jgi:hypothetical protein